MVVWRTAAVAAHDPLTKMNDMYATVQLGREEPQETDTHWRCADGHASFHWRCRFRRGGEGAEYWRAADQAIGCLACLRLARLGHQTALTRTMASCAVDSLLREFGCSSWFYMASLPCQTTPPHLPPWTV